MPRIVREIKQNVNHVFILWHKVLRFSVFRLFWHIVLLFVPNFHAFWRQQLFVLPYRKVLHYGIQTAGFGDPLSPFSVFMALL